jgi:hypothetical protein
MLAHFSYRPKFETWLDWKSRLFVLTKGGERKQEREDHSSYVKGFTKLQDKGQDASYTKGALCLR